MQLPAWWLPEFIIATGKRTAHLLPALLGALVGSLVGGLVGGLVGTPLMLGALWERAWGWSGG